MSDVILLPPMGCIMKETFVVESGVALLDREAASNMKYKRQVYEARITVRLDDEIKKFVATESERLKQPPSSVVRMMVAERMRSVDGYDQNPQNKNTK